MRWGASHVIASMTVTCSTVGMHVAMLRRQLLTIGHAQMVRALARRQVTTAPALGMRGCINTMLLLLLWLGQMNTARRSRRRWTSRSAKYILLPRRSPLVGMIALCSPQVQPQPCCQRQALNCTCQQCGEACRCLDVTCSALEGHKLHALAFSSLPADIPFCMLHTWEWSQHDVYDQQGPSSALWASSKQCAASLLKQDHQAQARQAGAGTVPRWHIS